MDGTVPRREELLLLEHITGKPREALILHKAPLPDEQRRAFFDAAERRRAGEPLQYILGEWDFYGLRFKVDKRALIPRSETELLVERITENTRKNTEKNAADIDSLRILDICTGSGCIAVALVKILGDAGVDVRAVATDISAGALSLAAENAALHGVAERVRFVRSDLAAGVAGVFDIVVSNPPYIPTAELAGLQTEVRDYEPRLALDGGADGMDLYRRLLPQAYRLLRPGGGLYLEIGPVGVQALAEAAGFAEVRMLEDYAGLPRMVVGTR